MSDPLNPPSVWDSQITQPSVPVNQNALRLQVLTCGQVQSKTTTAQPGSPTDGDVYIIPSGATGTAWATFTAGDVAIYRIIDAVGAWYAFTPPTGLVMNVAGVAEKWTGSAWVPFFGDDVISANLSADQNNYAPTGHGSSCLFRLAPQTTDRTVTGLAGGVTNRRITITNTAAALNLALAHESGSSSAGNRFLCPGATNLTIAAGASRDLIYDSTSSRWRVIGA